MEKYVIRGECVESDAPEATTTLIANAVLEKYEKHGPRVDTLAYAISEWLRTFSDDWHINVVQRAACHHAAVDGATVTVFMAGTRIMVFVPVHCGVAAAIKWGAPNYKILASQYPPNARYDGAALACVARCAGRLRGTSSVNVVELAGALSGEMSRELGEVDCPPWGVIIAPISITVSGLGKSTAAYIAMAGCVVFAFMR
jgi:hypothetical protein